MGDAVRFVLAEHGFKAGRYSIGYQSCDDSSAQTGTWTTGTCRRNARAYARQANLKDGILGSFRFDRYGDITPAPVMILRITGKTSPGAGLYPYFQGAEVDRVVRVPASLAG